MKNLLLSFTVLTIIALGSVNAQVQKTPFVEHFTQASCGPCASQNPGMYTILNTFGSANYVKLTYQVSWPGSDPMNAEYPAGPSARTTYYGVSGVPDCSLSGGATSAPNTAVTAATLAAKAAETTPYSMTIVHSWNNGDITVDVDVINVTTSSVSSMDKIYVAMVEDQVSYTPAPGSNGETDFYYVNREFYNASNGAAGATSGASLGAIAPGATTSYTFTIASANIPSYIRDLNQLNFVAFIQNNSSKAIDQAAKSIPGNVPGLLDLSTSTSSVSGAGYCNYSFDPVINFTNNSTSIPVTQFVVEYDINGGTPVQETYIGSLSGGASITINFPNTNLTPGMSTVNYNVVSVNNGANLFSAGAVGMASETFSKINSTTSTIPISEGFQGPDEEPAPTGAIADNPNGISAFTISDATVGAGYAIGGHGNSDGCFLWLFYGISAGESSKLVFEKLDFSGTSDNELTFAHAYAQYQAESDQLEISVSTDCGATWASVWNKSGATLATVPAQTANFFPNANQWVDNIVDLSAYDNAPDVMIAFEGTSNYGNNLFIDDINTGVASMASWDCDPVNGCVDPGAGSGQYTSITACNAVCTSTDITETISNLSVYPNPVINTLTIEGDYTSINIYDIFNKLVLTSKSQKEIDVSSLSNGLYFANIKNQNTITVKKITIAK
jgi:hypothetical protein